MTMRRGQRAARHIIMALPGPEQRLFTDYPIAFDQIDHAASIGDPPVPGQQLNRVRSGILDPDMIDPEPFTCLDPRLFGQKAHRDAHGDPVGDGSMLEKLFHNRAKVATVLPCDNR